MERSTEPDGARAVRIRAYLGRVQDVRRTFRAPAGADLAAFLKRAALAALPKTEGWHLLVVSVERTSEAEPVAPVLDRLAQRHMVGRDRAAARRAEPQPILPSRPVTTDNSRCASPRSRRSFCRNRLILAARTWGGGAWMLDNPTRTAVLLAERDRHVPRAVSPRTPSCWSAASAPRCGTWTASAFSISSAASAC